MFSPQSAPIRVLHLIQWLSLGGAGRAMIAIAKYTRRLGNYQHSAASLIPPDPQAVQLAVSEGMTFVPHQNFDELKRLMGEYDIVHVHWWNNPDLDSLFRSPLPPCRLLGWYHVGGHHAPQIVTKGVTDFFDYSLACSPFTYECPAIQDLPPQCRGMAYGAADFARLQGISLQPHAGFVVGYIGSLDFLKMHPDYVSMSASVQVPGVQFVVCGKGEDENTLRSQAALLGASDRIQFLGYIEELRPVIQNFDVYGYPLCEDTYAAAEVNLQEVMYAGVPPVVFPYGGVKHLVKHGETGLVVKSAAEYKGAIEELYRNPELRNRLGANAKRYAEAEFGSENAAKVVHQVYTELQKIPKRSRIWGKSVHTPILHQKVTWDDLIAAPAPSQGHEFFIASLGDYAGPFKISLSSSKDEELLAGEEAIFGCTELMRTGGIRQYRNYYPNDRYLRLWSGLALHGAGKPAEAINEFVQALTLGLQHWRLFWYLARAARQAGQMGIAQQCLEQVRAAAPDFMPAQGL